MNDRERLTAWAAEHGPAVFGFLRRRCGQDAEDLLQETFRKAWASRAAYQPSGRDRAFLITIADRLACDWARKRAGRKTVALEEAVDGGGGPEDRLAANEDRTMVREILTTLPDAQRRTLELRYFGDLTFKEIADALGCPLNTALSHAHRGLEALRQRLAERSP